MHPRCGSVTLENLALISGASTGNRPVLEKKSSHFSAKLRFKRYKNFPYTLRINEFKFFTNLFLLGRVNFGPLEASERNDSIKFFTSTCTYFFQAPICTNSTKLPLGGGGIDFPLLAPFPLGRFFPALFYFLMTPIYDAAYFSYPRNSKITLSKIPFWCSLIRVEARLILFSLSLVLTFFFFLRSKCAKSGNQRGDRCFSIWAWVQWNFLKWFGVLKKFNLKLVEIGHFKVKDAKFDLWSFQERLVSSESLL